MVSCAGVAAAVIGSQPEEEMRPTPHYYMIGSTAASLLLPLPATILAYFIMRLLIIFGKDEVERRTTAGRSETDGMELVELPANVVQDDEPSSEKKILAEFGNYAIKDVQPANFNSLKLSAAVVLFFAILFLKLALIGGEYRIVECVMCMHIHMYVQVYLYLYCLCLKEAQSSMCQQAYYCF